MRYSLLTVLIVAALAAPAAASTGHEAGASVPIMSTAFGTPRIDVLAGDTVTWRNDSPLAHIVAATDGGWASARLVAADEFSRRFDAEGTVSYYCRLHPGMRGEIDVHDLLLTTPGQAAAAGRPFALGGRSSLPAGSTVSIEADDGTIAATATVGAGGDFRATVTPRATTSFRAVSGTELSPPVQVLVLDRRVTATAHGHGRRVVVDAGVLPASPGATVVLQLHLRERFGWWPVRRARVGRDSTVRLPVRLTRRVRARVVLTLDDGATPLAVSPTLRVGPRR